jgi:phage repressor protein C with HTH and peptisase S24 domain
VNWGDVPTWIGIVAALGTGVYAAVIARGAKKATEAQANEMRTANAIAEEALRISKEAHRPAVAWNVQYEAGDTYKVTNVGTADAWDVEIEHEGMVRGYGESVEPRLRPTEAKVFMAAVHMQTRDNTVYVRWSDDPDGQRHLWRHPLPGKQR